jgi:uncharacterized membrane protein
MAVLGGAVAVWVCIHLGLAGSPLRGALVARIGDNGFRSLFSILSAIGLAGLIYGYGDARSGSGNIALWPPQPWAHWLAIVGMLPALVLLVGSLTVPNPGLVGADKLLAREDPARGILRVTRHPMLWSFALWAALHIIPNGDLASLLLFGAVLIVALAGMASIDRKRARSMPQDFPRFAAVTSVVPLAAIAAGRNRLIVAELGWHWLALAVVGWLAFMWLHPWAIGVPVLAG